MSIRTRASNRSLAALAFAAAFALAAVPAAAQEHATAEELFQLGKGAMARQDYTKACTLFQASLDADFALGTLLNLALCHEQAGKIASAWSEFRILEDKSRRAAPPQLDRAQFAHDKVEALRPRLSRVQITLSPEATATPGITIKIDGVKVAPELFDAGVPVDPGKRKLTAAAPDREEWSQIVAVDDEKLLLKATIPALRPGATKATMPAAGTVDLTEVERVSAQRSQRVVGFVVGGIGLAALGAGATFGVIALKSADDSKCPGPCYTTNENGSPNAALADAQSSYRDSNTFAWVSNVALGVGVVGLLVGGYLVLTAKPDAKPKAAAIGLTPLGAGGHF